MSDAAAPEGGADHVLQGGVGLAHPEDLEDFVAYLGLSERLDDIIRWCDDLGAMFLEEVVEHFSDLAEFLELSPEETQRVAVESRAALVAVHLAASGSGAGSLPWGDDSGSTPGATRVGQGQSLRRLSVSQDGAVGPSPMGAPLPGPASGEGLGRTFTITAGVRKAAEVFKANGGMPPRTMTETRPKPSLEMAGIGGEGGGLGRTATFVCHGPCSGVFGSMRVADGGTLEISKVHRKDAHGPDAEDWPEVLEGVTPSTKKAYDDAHKPNRGMHRCNTVGVETFDGQRRETLSDMVHEDGVRPVTLDAGQTGTVYALEVSGEKVAVFKPREGEHFSRKSVPAGEGHIREEAVYLVDRLTDSRAGVPVTSRAWIQVDDKTMEGSVQAYMSDVIGFIEDFAMPRDACVADEFVRQEAAEALALLDLRVLNTDRHPGNLLLLKHSKPHGLGPIDHGCCLPPWWLLGEANFDAWLEWPQLQREPRESTRQLALVAYERLPKTCDMLRGLGLPEAAIVTLRLCTALVKVAVGELAVPVGWIASLVCRDPVAFEELSWLEKQVQISATAAGCAVRCGSNDRGDAELEVDDGGAALDAQAFLRHIEEAFRAQVRTAALAAAGRSPEE